MALLHATATLQPGKLDVIKAWLPQQPWAGEVAADELVEVGSYRFDDPSGAVGLESILVRSGPSVFQVPLTYRAEPAAASTVPAGPIATMEHSALGTRYVYDGAGDPAFLTMLAAVTLTGVGQAAAVLLRDGRTHVRTPSIRLESNGGDGPVVAVDGFGPTAEQDGWALVRSPDLDVRVARRVSAISDAAPVPGAVVLTGRGPGLDGPVVLATVVVSPGPSDE